MARCFPGTSRRINFGEPFVFHFTDVDRKENKIKPNLPVHLDKVDICVFFFGERLKIFRVI